MRKVTARELRALGVGHGDPLPLPQGADVELAKASILNVLERLHDDDIATCIRVLKRAKQRIKKQPYQEAICQLLAQLEASSGKTKEA